MKEFLAKYEDGTFALMNGDGYSGQDNWIEVPEGSCVAYNINGEILFCSSICDLPTKETVKVGRNSLRVVDLSNIIWKREKESLNDKVASAEEFRKHLTDDLPEFKHGIDATLAERQKQYGCFEDVAHVTQGMIALMRQCGYNSMPATHQMALSMIASKMARLVNGDFNHKDGWHDISGYAKLIENLISDEKEMPF